MRILKYEEVISHINALELQSNPALSKNIIGKMPPRTPRTSQEHRSMEKWHQNWLRGFMLFFQCLSYIKCPSLYTVVALEKSISHKYDKLQAITGNSRAHGSSFSSIYHSDSAKGSSTESTWSSKDWVQSHVLTLGIRQEYPKCSSKYQ